MTPTSARSEYFSAAYAESRQTDGQFNYQSVIVASISLCFAVFIGAIVVTLRRPKRDFDHHQQLPFAMDAAGEDTRAG